MCLMTSLTLATIAFVRKRRAAGAATAPCGVTCTCTRGRCLGAGCGALLLLAAVVHLWMLQSDQALVLQSPAGELGLRGAVHGGESLG